MVKKTSSKLFVLSALWYVFYLFYSNYSTISLSYGAYAKAPVSPNGPTVKDNNLVVENVTGGFEKPTSMAFLGPNDILVTEKELER